MAETAQWAALLGEYVTDLIEQADADEACIGMRPFGAINYEALDRRVIRHVHRDDVPATKAEFLGERMADLTEATACQIDDLVGLRVTCTNLCDLDMVQGARDGWPKQPSPKRPLSIDESSERDYVESPKESGYRGWHVNLRLTVESTSVTCELQVRTLLQDSWGELTHEDSYSKAGELPPLVEILSKRMADLLATLDDIAEDLRSELDRIDEAAVDGADDQPDESHADGRDLSALEADAAEPPAVRWHTLDRPTDLSGQSRDLQKDFGAHVSHARSCHRSVKRFLPLALPAAAPSPVRQP